MGLALTCMRRWCCGGGDFFDIRKLDDTLDSQPNGCKALSVLISDNNTSH